MKTCKEFAALLDAFVDGELSPEEAAAVQEHLHTCSACQSYVDDALAIRAAFPTVEDTVVPADFAAGVMAAIASQSAPKAKKSHHWGKLMLPLAACFALVLLVRYADPVHVSPVEEEAPVQAAANLAKTPMAAEAAPESSPPQEQFDTATSGDADTPLPHASLYSVPKASEERDLQPPYFAQLTLTAEEAGNLLDEFSPVGETDSALTYELSIADYQTLVDKLSEKGVAVPQTSSDTENSIDLSLVTVMK